MPYDTPTPTQTDLLPTTDLDDDEFLPCHHDDDDYDDEDDRTEEEAAELSVLVERRARELYQKMLPQKTADDTEGGENFHVREDSILNWNMAEMLERLCLIGDTDREGQRTLKAQADLLNILFARTVGRAFEVKASDFEKRMQLALQMQRQFKETLRVRGALEYMSAISAAPSLKYLEQKEE